MVIKFISTVQDLHSASFLWKKYIYALGYQQLLFLFLIHFPVSAILPFSFCGVQQLSSGLGGRVSV